VAFSYEAASKLFRDGDFLSLVQGSGRTYDDRKALEPRQRVMLAHALAFLGQFDAAEQLAELDRYAPTTPAVRSQAESVLSIIRRRHSDLVAAVKHAQSAVFLAQESGDSERIAWAHLRLFRLLAEIGPLDKTLTSLADARRAVVKAGKSDITAYLHICVSVLEGQTGRVDEARRHCDIAEGLLEGSSNLWLAAGCLLNRGNVAWQTCNFDEASRLFRSGRQIASRIGYTHLAQAADISNAYLLLFTGEFEKAEQNFLAILSDPTTNTTARLASLDGLSRVYLAAGRLDEAQRLILDVSNRFNRTEYSALVFDTRELAITEARLLVNRNRLDDAIAILKIAEERSQAQRDIPLTVAAYLTHAQAASRKGDIRETVSRIVGASELNVTTIRERQAEYYYGCALLLGDSPALAQQLRRRAIRLWESQGVVSVRCEIDNALSIPASVDNATDAGDTPHTLESITNSLAAMNDVAHRPRLLAEEMVAVIEALECSPQVKIFEARGNDSAKPSHTTTVVSLGTEGGKNVFLVCTLPDEPLKAVLLADVLRMGRAALELERARNEERNRAAVWPADPVEEQAGALFISEDMQTLLATARRIAGTTVPVLITGETGTGKEVLARTIHAYSPRASATFLPFNCSSVPRDMLDSQLFGHRRGSFTGATENFPGVIRAASGGTLFLDEIGETTLEVQPKLLRFLDSNEVHPIGEVQPVKADVRVIAATNVDLDAFVTQGRFREDLFYRLNIVRLHVPPLRERRVEIPALATHYLQKHSQEYRKGDLRLAEETMEYLVLYRWPGNVRQLANEMRRLAALAETGAVLMPEHLSPDIAASRRTIPASERALAPTEVVVRLDQPVPAAVQHLERTMIQYALKACDGKMEETATMLGLSRKGLYLKRLRYGLEPPEGGASTTEVA
jgi:DNA-binding NtrC family response regulator